MAEQSGLVHYQICNCEITQILGAALNPENIVR